MQSNGTGTPTWATPVSYATVTDDTTSSGTRYPLFANQTSGNLTTEYTSSTKLQYDPSTGIFTSTSFSGAGTGLTGTASSLSIGGNAATATSATTATNIAGGAANRIPYQTGAGATSFITAPTVSNTALTWDGASFVWNAGSGGVLIADDTTTAADYYPLFSTVASGSVSTEYVSSTKLKYNPSTGALTASSFIGSGAGITGIIDISASTPTPNVGDAWWNSNYGDLYTYYNDGTNNQWVSAEAGSSGVDFTSFDGGPALTTSWNTIATINGGGAT